MSLRLQYQYPTAEDQVLGGKQVPRLAVAVEIT